MKRLVTLMILSLFTLNLMAEIPSARYVKKVSRQATQKAYKKLLSSKKGQEVYKNLMSIFEKNIMKIAKEGFYDTFSINIYNSDKLGIQKEMNKLSAKEQNMMRQLIISKLKQKG